MQLIMGLPEVNKIKVLRFLKNLPAQLKNQSLDYYINKYKNHSELNSKTTELSQLFIFKDDLFKSMGRNRFNQEIDKIADFIFSKFTDQILNSIKLSLTDSLSKKFEPFSDNRVFEIIINKVMHHISESFPFDFGVEIKSNFIHSIKPKVRDVTKHHNQLT